MSTELPTGGPGRPLGPGGPCGRKRKVTRHSSSLSPTPFPAPPRGPGTPDTLGYRWTGWSPEQEKCPRTSAVTRTRPQGAALHTAPNPHTKPTHPRTLQSLQADRSRKRGLGSWAELGSYPRVSPLPSPWQQHGPWPIHSPSFPGCLCPLLDPAMNHIPGDSDQRGSAVPHVGRLRHRLAHRDHMHPRRRGASSGHAQISQHTGSPEGPRIPRGPMMPSLPWRRGTRGLTSFLIPGTRGEGWKEGRYNRWQQLSEGGCGKARGAAGSTEGRDRRNRRTGAWAAGIQRGLPSSQEAPVGPGCL